MNYLTTIEDLEAHDPHGRFTILYPVNETGQDIYVHSKTSIIDDAFLRIGSSNIDRRSMGFDTESDVALIAAIIISLIANRTSCHHVALHHIAHSMCKVSMGAIITGWKESE